MSKVAFRVIQSNPFFDRRLIHSCGSSMIKKEKSYWTVFEKMDPECKKGQIWPLKKYLKNNSTKSISWQLINDVPKKFHAKNKVTEASFQKLALLRKVDANGQVGIRKASLPSGTAELKSWWTVSDAMSPASEHLQRTNMTSKV
jgi:hypothetical protein